MPHALDFAPVQSDEELREYARIVSVAFGWNTAMAARWVADCGQESARIVRAGGEIAGGLQLLPLGTYFGGRRIGLTGVGAVVVLPEFRGMGVGQAMMRAALAEIRSRGAPLAGLFPATLPLYRSAGFERAGVRYQVSLDLKLLCVRSECKRDVDIEVRAIQPGDETLHQAVRACYRRVAPGLDGHLDREEHIWRTRIEAAKCDPTAGYVFVRNGRVEGYLYVNRTVGASPQTLEIRDLVCETRGAMLRAIQFLADHRSIAAVANWMTVPEHPLLSLLRDHCFTCRLQDVWMLRVVDVAAALLARGYPRHLRGKFSLAVEDDLIPENAGSYMVEIANGQASVVRVSTESPDVRLDVRSLASVFSGFQSVRSLALSGAAVCGENADLVDAAFANVSGSTPWMTEIY